MAHTSIEHAPVPATDIPVLPTRGLTTFPGQTLILAIGREKSLAAVEYAKAHGGWILTLAQKNDESEEANVEDLHRIGVACQILRTFTGRDGSLRAVVRGVARYQVTSLAVTDHGLVAEGGELHDKRDADEETIGRLGESLRGLAIEIVKLLPIEPDDIIPQIERLEDPIALSHLASQYLDLSSKEAQELLEMVSLKNRLLRLLELLVVRKESLKVQHKIRETLSDTIGKQQREAMLREQLRAIQSELGEGEEAENGEDYRKRIADAKMPEEVAKVALREVARLERIGRQSPEEHVIRNYLDLLCDMPWETTSGGEVDLTAAEQVLERDHYGLEKIKQRILEHLAVMKLRTGKRGSILLLVGPPGVGKTSLGKSIAEALGRQFVRASLGGVRDDADIRGHRRTYVGALPGRIIDGIRRAKAKDPVFILDEIDKLARGWGGDPASALLEVLDPEQNSAFYDHYLDVPFDLSQVFFIATANSRETIPPPLLDRMEVIELTGYTAEEKFHIAKQHLLPAELESHGVKPEQLVLEDSVLERIIADYTREAGVRSLRRELTRVTRAVAARLVKESVEQVQITASDLTDILGPARFEIDDLDREPGPGVVTGMAWTPVGGEVLFVESVLVPGEGKVQITGQLGDVMQESSKLAVSLARKRLEGIASTVLHKERDIHLHVPAGAIPKDGPSAGVTMFTAIASMMLEQPVNPKLAMTGEITLTGKVLPVGGIKEKVLAARRFGIETVILPSRNRKDVAELPANVRETLTIHFVTDVSEVMEIVFGPRFAKPAPTAPVGSEPSRSGDGGQAWHHSGRCCTAA